MQGKHEIPDYHAQIGVHSNSVSRLATFYGLCVFASSAFSPNMQTNNLSIKEGKTNKTNKRQQTLETTTTTTTTKKTKKTKTKTKNNKQRPKTEKQLQYNLSTKTSKLKTKRHQFMSCAQNYLKSTPDPSHSRQSWRIPQYWHMSRPHRTHRR